MKKFIIALIVVLAMAGIAEGKEIKLKLRVTAYCEKAHRTASGAKVNKNTVALPPSIIKKYKLRYGCKIKIEGFEQVKILQDKMHPRWKDRCDVWHPSERWCREFGIRQKLVTIYYD